MLKEDELLPVREEEGEFEGFEDLVNSSDETANEVVKIVLKKFNSGKEGGSFFTQ